MARLAGFSRGSHFLWASLLGGMLLAAPLWAAPPQFVYDNDFAGQWGSSGSGDGQFSQPFGIARNSEGDIYVVDISNSRVQKFDAEGQFLSKFGTFGAGDGQFFSPSGVAINSSDEIYVVDFSASGNRVQQFAANGTFIRKWGTGGSANGEFQNPRNLCVAPDGNVYVADYGNDRIQIFEPDGDFVRTFGTSGTGDGELDFPDGIAVDGSGNVFVVDRGNHRVQVFNSSDTFVRQWGAQGTADGQFDSPSGLALGADGIVYVADFNNDRVQAFTTGGVFLGKWGTAGNGDGEFQGPNGVMATASGRVYVSNSDGGVGNRVQYFEPIWNVTMDEDGEPTDFALTLSAFDADADTITWSISSGAPNGTAETSGTGASKGIAYSPDVNYNGADNFDVQINDGNAGTATRTVNVTINPTNDGPVIDQTGPLQVTMSQDGNPDPFLAPIVTATDPEGDTILWSVSSAASHGTATVSGSGVMPPVFTYVPTAGYSGSDAFTLQASDGVLSDTIEVEVTIEPPAVAPVIDQGAGPLAVSMDEDGGFTAPTLGATDADTAAGALTWSVSSQATSGFADVSGSGASPSTFTYQPATDFEGVDSFAIEVSDGALTDSIVVNVTVNPINDDPVIFQGDGPLFVTMSEDGSPTDFVRPTLYATDVDGDTLTWSVAAHGADGTATVSGTGSSATVLGFTPNANHNGEDSFWVQVSDGTASDVIEIKVTINPVNDAPEIVQGAGPVSTGYNQGGDNAGFQVPSVGANDVDHPGEDLAWSVSSQASHGTATVSGMGAIPEVFNYVADPEYLGQDSFEVQVSDGTLTDTITINVSVNDANDLPEITQGAGPLTTEMDEDASPRAFMAPALDATDGDDDTLTWSLATQASNGTATVSGSGASPSVMTYVPEANYNGTDAFTVEVSDGRGGVAQINVEVTVASVNDVVMIDQGEGPLEVTMAEDEEFVAPELSVTDVDNDSFFWGVLAQPAHGTATVSGLESAPSAFSYVPTENFHGSDSFSIYVADTLSSFVVKTVNVTITPVNDVPTIAPGSEVGVVMDEDGVFTAPEILAADAEGDTITWSLVAAAAHGTATAEGTGESPTTLTYVPEANFNGEDSFTLQASDGNGGISEVTVLLTVSSINDLPEITQGAGPLAVTMEEDGTFTAPDLSATDLDGETLTWSLGAAPDSGTAEVSGDGVSPGTVAYMPEINFSGEDQFTVAVTDGEGGFDTIAITVTVTPLNDAPEIAQGDAVAVTMSEDGSPTAFAAPTIAASDADGDTLTWSLTTAATHGTATASGEGASPAITYVPEPDFNGSDSFVVSVSDGEESDEITVNVTVNPVSDEPQIAQGDSVTVTMDEDGSPTAFVAPVLEAINTQDLVGDLTWSLASAPAHGVAEVSGTGDTPEVLTYAPTASYFGTDQFTVALSDNNGSVDQIVVEVTIAPVNDAPIFASLRSHILQGAWDIPLPEGAEQLDRLPLAIGPENNVYVGDNSHIRIYDSEGTFVRDFAQFSADSLAVDDAGAVYGLFQSPLIMAKFNADGTLDSGWPTVLDLFPVDKVHRGNSISAAPGGAVQFMQSSTATTGGDPEIRLRGLNAAGGLQYTVNQPLARDNTSAPGSLIVGQGVNFGYIAATDAAGNAYAWRQYVTVSYSTPYYYKHRIEKLHVYNPQGTELRSIQLPGIPATAARRLAVRPDGARIYTSDSERAKVDVQLVNGAMLLPFGGPGTEEGRFGTVSGIAVNAEGRVYVSDTANRRIQYFEETDAVGEVTVFMSEDGGFTFPYTPSDPEGDTLAWKILEQPELGTAAGGATLSYTPEANYHGEVSFVAAVEDGKGGSTTLTIRVVIEPVQDPPVIAQGDADILVTMSKNGTPVAFAKPTLSATDVEGDNLSWSVQNSVRYDYTFGFSSTFPYYDPTRGTVSATGNGASPATITYTPPVDFTGTDSFTVVVTDSHGNTDNIVIRVIVSQASPTTTTPVLADLLERDFDKADVNDDGQLSRIEAVQQFPNMTTDQFDEIDTDNDGFLTLEEIQGVEEPPTPTGCNSPGDAKAFAETAIGKLIDAIREGIATFIGG